MFFYFLRHRNKTIKELRKSIGLTAKELAARLKCDPVEITRIDRRPLKKIPKDLRNRLIPIFQTVKFPLRISV